MNSSSFSIRSEFPATRMRRISMNNVNEKWIRKYKYIRFMRHRWNTSDELNHSSGNWISNQFSTNVHENMHHFSVEFRSREKRVCIPTNQLFDGAFWQHHQVNTNEVETITCRLLNWISKILSMIVWFNHIANNTTYLYYILRQMSELIRWSNLDEWL